MSLIIRSQKSSKQKKDKVNKRQKISQDGTAVYAGFFTSSETEKSFIVCIVNGIFLNLTAEETKYRHIAEETITSGNIFDCLAELASYLCILGNTQW